jgi:hypothetical protein
MPEFSDIELAIEYVSSAPHHTNRAVYDKQTGRILYASDMTGESEIPDDIDEEQCIEIPDKHDLDLGHNLVFGFIEQTLPAEVDTVRHMFKRSGAYGRFKEFLERRKLLQSWYDFESASTRKAIEEWCRDNGVEIG